VREAVAVGLGVTLISQNAVASELSSGRLVLLDAADMPMRRSWHIVTRLEAELPGAAMLFLDHLIADGGFARTA
jgi:DNA-binding transcriptional LysR family regulator